MLSLLFWTRRLAHLKTTVIHLPSTNTPSDPIDTVIICHWLPQRQDFVIQVSHHLLNVYSCWYIVPVNCRSYMIWRVRNATLLIRERLSLKFKLPFVSLRCGIQECWFKFYLKIRDFSSFASVYPRTLFFQSLFRRGPFQVCNDVHCIGVLW